MLPYRPQLTLGNMWKKLLSRLEALYYISCRI